MSNREGKLVIYKSSAGSGKTYTLVQEYVKLILENPDNYRRILAITFTNKAANEMKERIIKVLAEKSKTDENAKKALKLIIHNYSDFSVSTIDSFVQRISRIFARDLNLSPNYEVEIDSNRVMNNIVDLLISKVGHDKDITETLLSYTQSKVDDERSWHIEDEIVAMGQTIFEDSSACFINKLKEQQLSLHDFIAIRNRLLESNRMMSDRVREIANRACDYIRQEGLTSADFSQGGRGIWGYFDKLKVSGSVVEACNPNSYVRKAVEDDVWTKKGFEGNGVMNVAGSLKMCYNELQGIGIEEYLINEHIIRNLYSVSLLNEIRSILDSYIEENDIVPISEFNRKINEIISEEPIPYIYARMGERFKHILIDEFQDTSQLQWHNLIPLIENSLSRNQFNMIIGDAKQSIYRWRGGDAKQFVDLPDIKIANENLADAQRQFNQNYNPKTLNHNYRSKKEIVEFNNKLYDFITNQEFDNEDLKEIYKDQSQLKIENSDSYGGYVSMFFVEKQRANEKYSTYFNEIVNIINRCVNAYSKYGYKDIAILCRNNRDGAAIANHLSEKKIPIISKESLIVEASVKVRLIISLLKHIADTNAMMPKYEALMMLMEINDRINKREILDKMIDRNFSFYDILKEMGYVMSVDKMQKQSLYDTCEELVRIFRFNLSDDPYIITLLNIVHDYVVKNMSSIPQFIDWWNENKGSKSLNMPDEIDGVQLLTVHKSKGLQFPIVIYPFANDELIRSNVTQWVNLKTNEEQPLKVIRGSLKKELNNTYLSEYISKEDKRNLIDNINVMYVATTRAEEQLYIIADIPNKDELTHINNILHKFAEQQEGLRDEHYEVGNMDMDENCEEEKKVVESEFETHSFISTDWQSKVRAYLTYLDADQNTEKRDWGTLIHELLSEILTQKDIEPIVDKAIEKGVLEVGGKKHVIEVLNGIVTDSEIAPYFKEGLEVKTECEILMPNGKTIIPDRIIFEDKSITIIDYKTGAVAPEHQQQIDNYANALEQMGYRVENKIIYYTDLD